MKSNYINFDFIPFKIHKKYSVALKEIDLSQKVTLFNKYISKIMLYKSLLNRSSVTFVLYEGDIDTIHNELVRLFGQPKYLVHEGNSLWKVGGVYIEHGYYEDRLQDTLHVISITQYLPAFIMKNSDRYIKVNEMIDVIVANWQLDKASKLMIDIKRNIKIILRTDDFRYLVKVEKKKVGVYSHGKVKKDDGIHYIPGFCQVTEYTDLMEIQMFLGMYFMYQSEFDSCLEEKRIYDVIVKFYKDARSDLPVLTGGYRPYFELESGKVIRGVEFIEGTISDFDKLTESKIKLLYPEIDYRALLQEKKFTLLDGNDIVGEGVIIEKQ